MWADDDLVGDFVQLTDGSLVDPAALIGPDPSPTALSRLGRRLVLAPDDKALIPKSFDKRLRCYHGGLTPEEVEIPLLVG